MEIGCSCVWSWKKGFGPALDVGTDRKRNKWLKWFLGTWAAGKHQPQPHNCTYKTQWHPCAWNPKGIVIQPVPSDLVTFPIPWSHLRSSKTHPLPLNGPDRRQRITLGSVPGGSDGKRICLQCKRPRFDPCIGKNPGEENGYPLQYSCLENPMDRRAWRVTVRGVAKSQTQLPAPIIHSILLILPPECPSHAFSSLPAHRNSFSSGLLLLTWAVAITLPPSPWSRCLKSTLIHSALCSHKRSVYMMLFSGLDFTVLIHGLSLVIWTSPSSPPASCIPLTHMCGPPAVCYVFIPLSLSRFCFPCLEYHGFPLLFFQMANSHLPIGWSTSFCGVCELPPQWASKLGPMDMSDY